MRYKAGQLHDECLALARRILDDQCDPIVGCRLLRDVLRVPSDDPELQDAHAQVLASPQVTRLTQEQWPDGSWGRLHTADRFSKQRTGTTQGGVGEALSMGMTAQDVVLVRAADYLTRVLRRECTVPDRAERNDRWPTGVQLFAGSTLAQIHRMSPVLDDLWNRWAEILARTFARGRYDADAEEAAHRDLHGIHDGVGYLGLSTGNVIKLLGARAKQLPTQLRRAYLQWLWEQPNGLGYLSIPLFPPPAKPRGWAISGCLGSFDLLFDLGERLLQMDDCIDWLWDQRKPDGLWDFGPSPVTLRFSPNWRRKGRRAQDHSLFPLALITRFLRDLPH